MPVMLPPLSRTTPPIALVLVWFLLAPRSKTAVAPSTMSWLLAEIEPAALRLNVPSETCVMPV